MNERSDYVELLNKNKLHRHFILSKSRYGSFRLVLYKQNTDDIENAQANDVEDKKNINNAFLDEGNDSGIDAQKNNTTIEKTRNFALESLLRTKRTILDLALNNPFCYFVTFTFDRRKIDRNNVNLSRSRFLTATNNYYRLMKHHNTQYQLNYIAVPEWHDKKDAIHFHCLMSDLPDLIFSHYDKQNGYDVYKSPYFLERFGAVYAVKITDYNKFITYYIAKYVTKNNLQIFEDGKQRYFRSKGLDRSLILHKGDIGKMYLEDLNNVRSLIDTLIPDYTSGYLQIFNLDELETVQKFIDLTSQKDD